MSLERERLLKRGRTAPRTTYKLVIIISTSSVRKLRPGNVKRVPRGHMTKKVMEQTFQTSSRARLDHVGRDGMTAHWPWDLR